MNDRDRTMTELQEELERLRRRIAELESPGAGGRCGEEPEIRDQAIQSSINGIALSDLSGKLTFVNQAFLEMWGYNDASEVLGRPAVSFWDSAERAERVVQVLGERGGWVGEMTAKRKNGDRFPAQLSATVIKGRTGNPLGMMGSFIDITERRQAEAKTRNVTRLYAFLSQINQAIVRTRDRDELFRNICQVAVEFGQFRMAWIGLIDEATGIVQPVVHAGQEEGYLRGLSIRIGDETTGKGPTGSALREGGLTICDDIATDPHMLPWRDEALKRGYRSSAAIPFRVKEKVIGTLNLYATEPGFFTEDEQKLLIEIGIDISFALDNLEREQERKLAEEALRESEERYRTLFETMAQGVVYQAQDGRIISANHAAERILGVSLDQMQGRTSLDPRWRAIHEDGTDFPGDQHPSMEALRTGRPVHGVTMGVFHPGLNEYRWVLVNAVPEFLPGKTRPYRVYATFADITDRRRAEEALKAAKAYAENLIETANTMVVRLDAGGDVTVFNQAAETITGYSRAELQKRNWFEVVVPKERYPHVWAEFERLMAGGPPKQFENPILTKSGEERYIVWRNNEIYENGKVTGTISFGLDITDRRKIEEALRKSEERLNFMMSNSPAVIYTCRPSGDFGATFVSSNVAHQLGYDSHEFTADAGFWAAHIHPDDKQRVFDGLSALFAEGTHAQEYRFRHKDGTWRWMHDELRLVRDASGEPVEIIGSWVDITDRKWAEEALRESERKYRTLFDSATDAVFILDLDGTILDVNWTAHTRLGYTKQEMLSMHITRLDPPEFAARVPERLAQISRSGVAVFESAHIRKDGSVMPVEVNSRLLEYEGRQVYFSIVRDITERKRLEEELKESEEKFRAVFDSASDGILLVDPHSKRFLLGNATIARMLGVGQDDLPRMKVEDIHPPDALPYIFQSFEKVARGETLFSDNLPVQRKDGSVFFADIATSWITLKGVTYMAGFFRDITERRKAEAALRESEERFRSLLARVDSVAVQGFGPDGIVHYWNKASERLYGFTTEEAQGSNILDLIVPGEARGPIASAIAQMAGTGSPLPSSEATLLCKDGSCVTVHANYAVVNMPGRAPELYCIDIDLTDRKQAEQERLELERRLLHAQKLESLGILAGGIAHDFNNLLMAVLGNLDLALRKISPVSPARANIEQSAQAARRATDLTRQMLAYSGKGRFIVKAMDLSELVEENTHLFRASVARTATLDIRLGRSLPPIEADAGQVQQVIMNLITNASEAIGDNSGRITITTGLQECDAHCLKRSCIEDVPPAGRFVFLEVSDTGCGMDEETQQRLFDPFFTTKAPGRGLGMSAILGIVRGHGGAIFVESEPGRGTTIRILFPALEGTRAENEATGAHSAEAGEPAVSGTVLVVDDEEIVRTVCREMVESMGLPVLTAVDGRDAIDVFARHTDSITHVILDLSMPNMDGMAAFTELVRIKPGVKVIMSSGYDEQESVQRLFGRGLAGFIQKPYSLKNLRDAFEKA